MTILILLVLNIVLPTLDTVTDINLPREPHTLVIVMILNVVF